MSRRKGRELAMQMLFQEDAAGSSAQETKELFWAAHSASPEAREFAEALYDTSVEKRCEIDELISGHAQHWKLERIAAVERSILRVAIAELLATDTPDAVVMDEAIEIARKYASERSSDFVNGILDAVRNNVERSAE